jgi:outer membrane protein TolC
MVAGCASSKERDQASARAAEDVLKALGGTQPAPAAPLPDAIKPVPPEPDAAPPVSAKIETAKAAAPKPTILMPVEPKAAPAKPETAKPADAARPKESTPIPPPVIEGEVQLTLAQVVQRALAHNPDVQMATFQPPIAKEDVIAAEAVFDPTAYMNNTFGRVDRPVQSLLDTGITHGSLIEDTWSFQGGLRQKIPTGGTFAVYESWDNLRSNSPDITIPDPQYSTRTTFELAQPLLRGAGVEYNRAPIRVANLNADIAYADFRKAVTDGVATTINAYWQLAFDTESVHVSQASLDLAADVLRREKARQARGVSSEVDLNRAAAAVALRQADLVRTVNQARDSMDHLKLLMNAPDLPLAGDARIVPVETPRFFIVNVDRTEAIVTALANRPELERARNAVAINRIRTDVADKDRLPKLDATLRYIMNGLGTTFPQGLENQDFGERISWTAMFEMEVPLGNRAANALLRRRQLEYQQSLIDVEKQAAQATTEVNTAVRAVVMSRQEVESTMEAVDASAKQVHGEQVKFELGQTTSDELLRAQETLATAQRDRLKALLNFNLGLVSLARAEGVLLDNQGIEVIRPEPNQTPPRPLGMRIAPDTRPKTPAGVILTPPETARPAATSNGK